MARKKKAARSRAPSVRRGAAPREWTTVRKRKELFWGILKGNVGGELTLNFLKDATKSVNKDHIGIDACRNTLTDMRNERCPLPGGVLTVGQKTVRLTWMETVFDERQQRRPRAKRLLGALLWEVLFGVKSESIKYEQPIWAQSLEEKIGILRGRPLATLVIDAGSTTLAAAEEFNRLKPMPLRMTVGSGADKRQSLVRCNIISNSVKIIEEIRGGRHRDDIGLTIVGGDVRGQRSSVCGQSAQVFLHECASGGDVAIIGSTGYGGINGERRSFYSDNLEEATLKTAFLNRAWLLRILLFDSSKLVARKVTRVFADLTPETVDLIITDDGHDDETPADYKKQVRQFCDHARQNNISVAVLKLAD